MEETPDTLLPWTKSWRKIYAERAASLGYECSWNGSGLNFKKNGRLIGDFKPKERFFSMESVVEGLEQKRLAELAELYERESERLSRRAAGEPRPIRKRGDGRYGGEGISRWFAPMLAMAASSIGWQRPRF